MLNPEIHFIWEAEFILRLTAYLDIAFIQFLQVTWLGGFCDKIRFPHKAIIKKWWGFFVLFVFFSYYSL